MNRNESIRKWNMHKPYAFDRVIVRCKPEGQERFDVGMVGRIYSDCIGGPNMCEVSDCMTDIFGGGLYGIASYCAVGFAM